MAKIVESKIEEVPRGLRIGVKLIHPDAKMPTKAYPSDAAYDLTAISFEKKDFTVIASTGLILELPVGYEAQVRSRSGHASQGIIVVNSPGTVDATYRGEVKVILGSVTGSCPFFPNGPRGSVKIGNVELKPGARVAQMVIQPVLKTELFAVDEVDENTDRGAGGFGSTGV